MSKVFKAEKKCAYCKGELAQDVHPQTRAAWCCEAIKRSKFTVIK